MQLLLEHPAKQFLQALLRPLRRVALNSTTWHRKLVTFPMPGNGTIKIVQHGKAPVGIDAITVER